MHAAALLVAFGLSLLALCVLYCFGRIVIVLHGLTVRANAALAGVRR